MNAVQRSMVRRLVHLADQTKEARYSVYTKRQAVQKEKSGVIFDIARLVAVLRSQAGARVDPAMSDREIEADLARRSAGLRDLIIVRGELEAENARLDLELGAMEPDTRAANTLAERVLKCVGVKRDDLRMLNTGIFDAASLGVPGGFRVVDTAPEGATPMHFLPPGAQ